MSRPIDITKKSNIKCEHCKWAEKDNERRYFCTIHQKPKHYWNCCVYFDWKVSKLLRGMTE